MIRFPIAVFLTLLLSVLLNAQDASRQQKLDKIKAHFGQIDSIVSDLVRPSQADIDVAAEAGVNVFRILPREVYGRMTRERGAYYSFTTVSHDYQSIAQIGLEQNSLKVGFAGADYGFIGDLGNVPISRIDQDAPGVAFLAAYKPPKLLAEIRGEQRRSHRYETGSFTYSSYVPAKTGHTYVLRAISFDRADILVLFTVFRKDEDGSLIIFWKKLTDFEKPYILHAPDNEIRATIDRIIAEKGLRITVDVQDNKMIWLGAPSDEDMRELRKELQGKEVRIRGEDFSKLSQKR